MTAQISSASTATALGCRAADQAGALRSRGLDAAEAVVAIAPAGYLAFPTWTSVGVMGQSPTAGEPIDGPGTIVRFAAAGDQSLEAIYRPNHIVESLVASASGDLVAIHELDPPEVAPRWSTITIIRGSGDPMFVPLAEGMTLVSLGADGKTVLAIDSSTGDLVRADLSGGIPVVLAHDASAAAESSSGVLAIAQGRRGDAGVVCVAR